MGFMRGLTIAAALLALAAAAAAQSQQRRPVTEGERREANAALDAFTAPTLTRFGSEAEFRRYVEAARRFDRTRRRYYYAAHSGPRFAQAAVVGLAATQSETVQPVCPPEQPDCLQDDRIVVTGSRAAPPSNPSITNNQRRNVEEGDIVKQIGQFLLVLQDGRIFVVDTRARGGGELALVDRADVYRDPASDMWYDEMLVFGDRVLITGYSYDEAATELAVFRLGETGRLIREGVFRISSNDYYSSGNYATRLIGGNLVTYSPLEVSDIADGDFRWPVVRRWLPQDDARERAFQTRRRQNWRLRRDPPPAGLAPMIDAAAIYRPVRRIEDPMVHSVSVCPLASADDGRDLNCRTTSFIGPNWPEWYVTEAQVYLWTTARNRGGDCDAAGPLAPADAAPALVYRVPISGARPDLAAARGAPPDQFAMHADAGNFYALVRLERPGCTQRTDAPAQLAFFSLPLARFGPTLAQAPAASFTELPGTAAYSVASRFTERYLVYGGLSGYRRYPVFAADDDPGYRRRVMERLRPQPAYAVPIGRPEAFRPLTIGHTVIRAERVADDILLTGYRDGRGLSLTLIGLDGRPRVASTALLPGRYESEGRSHAFNSRIDADGSGLMGLPTVGRISDADRYSWRSSASDLSFLALDTRRRLRPIGTLERRFDYVDEYNDARREADEDGVPGYRCEVSCIDWYGNSRPIFTDGRIFGLSGTELIEGRIEAGRIAEVQRLNIALESTRPR